MKILVNILGDDGELVLGNDGVPKLGLVELEELVVTDIVTFHDNARVTATEWRKEGALVRRDVNANILRGLELGAQQGSM